MTHIKLDFVALFIFALSGASSALSKDGSLAFIGNITSSTCCVSVNGGNANTSINLGTYYLSNFPYKGAMATPIPFTISLINCKPAVAKVAIIFDGTADSNDHSVFTNVKTGINASRGTGVRLYNDGADSSDISPHGISAFYSVLNNSVTLPFTVRVTSTANNVTSGILQADTDFTISYQ
ncbi:fimbrial protein [Rahnella contaminans]|uniref:fimbrial protein n=1 Tax=Rahnella contaminans TaxID=2703882 RepID=UPI003C2E0A5E